MGKLTDLLVSFVTSRLLPFWHSVEGVVLTALISAVGLYLYLIIFVGWDMMRLGTLVPVALLAAVVVMLWAVEHRLKRVPLNKIGIILSITSDDDAEARQIQVDFVKEIKRQIRDCSHGSYFEVVNPPSYLIDKMESGREGMQEILKRYRAHFILKGDSRLREVGGKKCHLLRMQALVMHSPIPKHISEDFSRRMSGMIPPSLRVSVDGDAIAFESASAQVGLGARYAIATAASLSGDLVLAEDLLAGIESQLKAYTNIPQWLEPLNREVPGQLNAVYEARISIYGRAYHMTRKKTLLTDVEPFCDKLLKRDPNHYLANLKKAMIHFVIRRDLAAARQCLMRCVGANDCTYGYGVAFLLAYEGRLQEAHEEYRKAFRKPIFTETVPVQSEEFIQIVIDEEPDKSYLLFCTGLINYNAKNDYLSAANDFRRFLTVEQGRFPWAKLKAQELLMYAERWAADVSEANKSAA